MVVSTVDNTEEADTSADPEMEVRIEEGEEEEEEEQSGVAEGVLVDSKGRLVPKKKRKNRRVSPVKRRGKGRPGKTAGGLATTTSSAGTLVKRRENRIKLKAEPQGKTDLFS